MEMVEVMLRDVHPSPANLRKRKHSVADLAQSVASVGVLEPLLVSKNGKGYEIIAGHRRFEAAKQAKLKSVPAVVMDVDDATKVQVMLIENLQRDDLSPIEEGYGYRRLVDDFKYSQRDLAQIVGVSQAHVSKRIALTKLPPKAQEHFEKGDITVTEAQLLVDVHPDDIEDIFDRPKWQSFDAAIRSAKQERAVDEAATQAAKVAEPKGWVVSLYRDENAAQPIGEEGWRHYLRDLKVKEHEKLPCHALLIDRDAKVVPACADPDSHNKKGSLETKRAEKHREEEARRTAVLKERRKERRDFLYHKVAARVPANGRTELVKAALMQACGSESKKLACKMLGLQAADDGQGYQDYSAALWAYEGPTDRLVLALCVGAGELSVSGNSPWKSQYGQAYLGALKVLGYEPSKEEQELVNGTDA